MASNRERDAHRPSQHIGSRTSPQSCSRSRSCVRSRLRSCPLVRAISFAPYRSRPPLPSRSRARSRPLVRALARVFSFAPLVRAVPFTPSRPCPPVRAISFARSFAPSRSRAHSRRLVRALVRGLNAPKIPHMGCISTHNKHSSHAKRTRSTHCVPPRPLG
jgi:hypothetical protein